MSDGSVAWLSKAHGPIMPLRGFGYVIGERGLELT
jgi:hypothetical protein